MRRGLLIFGLCVATACLARAQIAVNPGEPDEKLPPAKTAEEIEHRYAAVLGILKKPPITGVLIAELGPFSVGGSAGLRPGDILVQYLGVRLDNPKEKDRAALLRQTVTRAIQQIDTPGINPVVTMIVHRDGKNVVLSAERESLGIFCIPVEAGVAMPLNPVESERGSFKTTWADSDNWYRISMSAAEGTISVERHVLQIQKARDNVATLTIPALAINKPTLGVETVQNAQFTFQVSDRTKSAAITVDTLAYSDDTAKVAAVRRGGVIRGTIERKYSHVIEKTEHPTLTEAIPTLAVTHLAAALPQEAGVVIGFPILSELDLQTRPGYALETRGKVKTKIQGAEVEAFAVRFWHFGQPQTTFYFSEKRRLLAAVSEAGGPSMTRSENGEDARKSLVILKDPPESQPATEPH